MNTRLRAQATPSPMRTARIARRSGERRVPPADPAGAPEGGTGASRESRPGKAPAGTGWVAVIVARLPLGGVGWGAAVEGRWRRERAERSLRWSDRTPAHN